MPPGISAPSHHRSDAAEREEQHLQLPRNAGNHQHDQPDNAASDREPQKERSRRCYFQRQQHHRQHPPVPEFGTAQDFAHGPVRVAIASFASSAAPAIAPITPEASSGISTSFSFGAEAILAKASTYFCATK